MNFYFKYYRKGFEQFDMDGFDFKEIELLNSFSLAMISIISPTL